MARQKFLIVFGGLFLFAFDQFLKWQALHTWTKPLLALRGWFGWQPFFNRGIAFSLPVPPVAAVVVTVPVLVLLIYYFVIAWQKNNLFRVSAFWLIIIGAISNVLDRLVYAETVDFFRIITGVFNVADFCIVLGAGLLVWGYKKISTKS